MYMPDGRVRVCNSTHTPHKRRRSYYSRLLGDGYYSRVSHIRTTSHPYPYLISAIWSSQLERGECEWNMC